MKISNTSKILMIGLAGTAAFLIARKIIMKNREIFEDIFFDSEFLPETDGAYQPVREHAQQPPFRRADEDPDDLFV